MPDFDQTRGQIDRVVDAAVHAHAAEWIVDMRGVAGEERASTLERLRHTLMHLVKRDVGNLVIRNAGHHRGHKRLRKVGAYRELVAFVRRGWQQQPAGAREWQ